MDGWMARHEDGCRQASRHLQPWLDEWETNFSTKFQTPAILGFVLGSSRHANIFFSTNWPWGPLAWKNCRLTWIPAYLVDCPVFQNPREVCSRSRIFLFSLVYVFMYVFIYLFVSRLLAKRRRYRPEIWYTYSLRPYRKMSFLFFRKNDPEGR